MPRKALLVGINHYDRAPDLSGCINDAQRVKRLLCRHENGELNFECKMLTSDAFDVSTSALRRTLIALFKDQAEASLFFFSGHGALRDYGGFLAARDSAHYNEGVDMHSVLALANAAVLEGRHRQVVMVLDCCHSGKLGEMNGAISSPTAIHEGVSILTASRAHQESKESKGRGHFTHALCNALEGAAADLLGNITVGGIYSHLDQLFGAWDQRPMLKANVSAMLALRKCRPRIPRDTLEKLFEYFPESDHEVHLAPSFEPTISPRILEHERVFNHLLQLHRAGLVQPKTQEHMYYAALESDSVHLSALGKYYRQLVMKELTV